MIAVIALHCDSALLYVPSDKGQQKRKKDKGTWKRTKEHEKGKRKKGNMKRGTCNTRKMKKRTRCTDAGASPYGVKMQLLEKLRILD